MNEEDKVFIEKDIYVEPPKVPENLNEEDKLLLWKDWLKRDEAKRRAHKAAFTRKQKAESLSEVEYGVSTYKSGGVHKQQVSAIGIEGDEESLERIVSIPATQDRHIQVRGKRGGKRNNNRKNKRKKSRKRKAQTILNKRNYK